ncbi:hypothetical protein AB0L35_11425 [Streptomyces sp. NPDC052309]|uniref:Uncharacterized protein n=1 Tax=Streptomyces griseicoloratus TaxID=2752516 RepID=A0A926L4W3_9ACTN|nr:hypothetical protein [Streptomyces griseicoloratus]MBD0420456.1 hypothetical protein [Streptomyces griseicoloratus]
MEQFESTSGLALLSGLVEALGGLSCMDDAQGRLMFAEVLAQQLGVPIDLRGVRLREDVVSLVRTALSVPGGERVLVSVVEVFEGAAASDELERLIAPAAGPADPAPHRYGPLSQRDVATARALLDKAEDELSWTGLRDGLADETGLDLPIGLSPAQLLSHVLEWNVQPDGLPPAVLLMEHAAATVRSPGRRGALSAWAEDWASRSGLLGELEHRRTARAGTRGDPSIPRCLLVVVEPARDGTGDITVRPWINTVPGHWNPLPAEPATTTLDGLGAAVEQTLRQMARLASLPQEPSTGFASPPPYVEFVLPYDLLNHDVAGLAFRTGDGRPLPLGLKYGVHLRSLERMRSDDALVRHQWRERWRTLQTHGVSVYEWQQTDAQRQAGWQAGLAGDPRRTAAVLDAPDGGAAMDALKTAIAEGIGLAVWDRRGHFPPERREVVGAVFAAVPTPEQIPVAIHRLRRQAELRGEGPLLLGRSIAFFWDDPTRLVDVQETDADVDMFTIDSEESGT